MRKAFVCGYPISHSRSPLIHRFWLRKYGIDGAYDPLSVPPDELHALVSRIRAGEFAGGNVTLPLKEEAFTEVDRRDEAADTIGAVNTLWREGPTLWGGNTDAYGFAANLDAEAPGWAAGGGTAVVLGAGGASRAVLHALVERGFDVSLTNRTLERAEGLASHFGPRVHVGPWEERQGLLEHAKLLVNTTSLGMTGKDALELDLAALPSFAVVTDIVYVPLETPLIKAAKARNDLQVVDGLGMLLHQAVPGFERWFGLRPEVTPELRALIVEDILRAHP
ncbi:MAG: shikimate dehydrogenase [Methylobacterium mesophilicum]|nr:shikimate dehydrogenase [Methylobacterium mesophilicum]